jgi:hypothetical protein
MDAAILLLLLLLMLQTNDPKQRERRRTEIRAEDVRMDRQQIIIGRGDKTTREEGGGRREREYGPTRVRASANDG